MPNDAIKQHLNNQPQQAMAGDSSALLPGVLDAFQSYRGIAAKQLGELISTYNASGAILAEATEHMASEGKPTEQSVQRAFAPDTKIESLMPMLMGNAKK